MAADDFVRGRQGPGRVRSNGEPTYLAADIAYMQESASAASTASSLPVGSDHHAYARTLKAAMAALGGDPDTVESPIIQFVHLVHEGEAFAMSKRRGDFVTLDELLDVIGVDATRYFMLQQLTRPDDRSRRRARAQAVAREPRLLHPVRARANRVDAPEAAGRTGLGGRGSTGLGVGFARRPRARPDQEARGFSGARSTRPSSGERPHRIAGYALELAQDFTAFYEALSRHRGDARVGRVVPSGVVVRGADDDRAVAPPARRERTRLDVAVP